MTTKAVIFDLDGVLIDSRMIHFYALNGALNEVAGKQYLISMDDHTSKYDGLSTTNKLKLLTKEKGLDPCLYGTIWQTKQKYTISSYNDFIMPNAFLVEQISQLRNHGIKIAVASNSIRETIDIALNNLGISNLVDLVLSNESVIYHKPHPQIYLKAMGELGSAPHDTVIFEDSHIGRTAATLSGAHLIPIKDSSDLTKDKFVRAFLILNEEYHMQPNISWRDPSLNVVIPMAGAGSRFAQAGYTFPKPLIDVRGQPMIKMVVDNLNIEANYIFIVQKEHLEKYNLTQMLGVIAPGCKIVVTDGLTDGAARTVLLAKDYINNDNPLFIANSDQFVEWDSNEVMYAFEAEGVDAGIVTFENTHPKYSYVRLGEDGFVAEVAEKKVISNLATVGFYWTKHGSTFVQAAEQMIAKDIRTNGEFYVAPVFNEIIDNGGRIRVKQADKMWGTGTPEDLQYFLQHYDGEL